MQSSDCPGEKKPQSEKLKKRTDSAASLKRVLLAAAYWTILSPAQSAGIEDDPTGSLFRTEVTASTRPLVAASGYKLWVPDSTGVVRTIFAINMRAAGEHLFHQDMEWRAMAQEYSAAMMYCEFEANGVRDNGYGHSMLAACDQFAAELGRPELRHAPLVLWGHSMGGRVAQDFVRFRPSRVLAFHLALRKLPSKSSFMGEEPIAMGVPALYLMGEKDGKPQDIRNHFVRARATGAPRAWVWLPSQSHWPKGMHFDKDNTTVADWRAWAANDVVIPWTKAMIQMRLPDDADPRQGPVKLRSVDTRRGWLGDVETGRVSRYREFSGRKSTASWFPDGDIARRWAAYCYKHRSVRSDRPGS